MMKEPTVEPRMPRCWWAAGGLAVLLLVSFFFDAAVDRWVAAHQIGTGAIIARACSRFLAWHWLMLAALVGLLIAWWRQRRDWARLFCVMIVAASVAGLSADVLRATTGRTRPSATAAQGWYGVRSGSQWLIIKNAYNSFPSGHTTAAAGFAFPLFFWRRRFGWLSFPFIGAVAGARIYVSAHHLSDVIAATLLGMPVAAWIWRRSAGGELFVRALLREKRVPA